MDVKEVQQYLKELLNDQASPVIQERGRDIYRNDLIQPAKINLANQEIYFRAQGTHTYTVVGHWSLEVDGLEFHFTCDCPFPGFCKHQAAGIYHIYKRPQVYTALYENLEHLLQYAASLFPMDEEEEDLDEIDLEMPVELEEEGRAAMKQYGLPLADDWKDYFEWDKIDTDRYELMLKEPYRGLINPDRLNGELLNQLQKSDPNKELPIDKNPPKEAFYYGFYWVFYGSLAFSISPMIGVAPESDKPFQKKIKSIDDASPFVEVQALPQDEPLLGLCRMFKQVLEGQGGQEDLARCIASVQQYVSELEAHPRIYIHRGNPYNPKLRRSDLQRVHFIGHSPPLKVDFREMDGFVYMEPLIWIQDDWQPLQSDAVEQMNNYFLRFGDQLYFHSSHRQAEVFRVLNYDHKLCCLPDKFPQLVESLWSHLAPFCEFDLTGLSSFKLNTKDLELQQKELYLSEVGNFIVFKPVVRYTDGSQVEALSTGDMLHVSGEQELQLAHRPKALEAQFVEEVRNLHPQFQQQNRPDFFYLKRKQLLENDWFLKAFPRMLECNIAVYGWKGLSDLKVNPHPAKVQYRVDHKTDWFDTQVQISFGDTEVRLEQLSKSLRPDGYIRLHDGTWGLLPEEWVQRLQKLMEHGQVEQDRIRVSDKLFTLVDELFEEVKEADAAAFIAEKKEKLLAFDHLEPKPLPKKIKATLRHYQEDGFQWLCFLHEFQWGGILADDMGLGKTLQVITFLMHVLEENSQANLIIVPTSLLFNWENELQKFAPHLKAYFHHGKNRLAEPQELENYELVFTSYGLLTRDLELLRQCDFNYLVLDESQAIKNPSSQRYKAARLIPAQNRLALTGTPVENHTFDLYAQLSFLNPGLLGTAASFKKRYALPIDKHGNEERAAELQSMIRPFVIRRTKEQVADELPDKVEDVLYCEMKPAQRKVYDAFRNRYRDKLLHKIEEEGVDKARFSVLEGLTKLRQICDAPSILGGEERFQGPSAKIDQLLQHIREKTGQHKILVFSQFVRMLRLIEEELHQAGISYAYLDGKSNTQQRQESVRNFQENEQCRVFLISLKAGGTGLNLVAADYVYLVDPWWNPAVENQAIDRSYRIGQDKKVIAYRMICKDTIEEKILKLQQKKKALASDLVQTDEKVLQQLDKATIQSLFA